MAKDDDLRRVGRAVAARRGELGMTQQDLADAAGVDLKTVYNLESGIRWPIAKTRTAVSAAIGWDGDALAVILDGGTPAVPDPDWRPEPAPGMVAIADIAAAEPYVAGIRQRYDELRADGSPVPTGAQMYPQWRTVPEQAGYAAAWDAARRYAPGPTEAERLGQQIWLLAFAMADRAAWIRDEGNADSALTAATPLPRQADLPFPYRSRAGNIMLRSLALPGVPVHPAHWHAQQVTTPVPAVPSGSRRGACAAQGRGLSRGRYRVARHPRAREPDRGREGDPAGGPGRPR